MEPSVPPPQGQEERQATDLHRAIVYQAWRAVYAWLRLNPGQALFLEHAEDFDIASVKSAEGTQVKDKTGELSLGRVAARDAITNYWRLRDEENRDVKYRHLTTERRGFEQGDPFDGRKGLDVWDNARKQDEPLRLVVDFLKDQDLPADLVNFLTSASTEKIREELILPINWQTRALNRGDIKRLIEGRLVEHGQSQVPRVPPSRSKQVKSALFEQVTEKSAEDNPRRLTLADFADLFEQETTDRVPSGTRGAAIARTVGTRHASLQAGSFEFLEPIEGSLLSVTVPRSDLTETIRERADHLPLSALVGSSGMGKSTLAKLAAEEGGWYLINFQDKDPDQVQKLLHHAILGLADVPDGSTVLLDNLNFEQSTDEYVGALRKLITAAREQAIHIVVTTQNPVPFRIKTLVQTDSDEIGMPVPSFNEAEVRTLLEEYGCPESIRGIWTTAIMTQTSGHPQLADAHASAASQPQWQKPSQEDLLGEPKRIEEVKRESRTKLRQELPEDSLQLARRLSLLTHPFTREKALNIAEIPPPIRTAGTALDFLVGPWIEPLPNEHYRVSPLLSDLHRDTLTNDRQNELRHDIATAFVEVGREKSSITAYGLSEILSNGLLSENEEALFVAASSCLNFKNWSEVAPHIEWFAAAKTGRAQGILLDSHPGLSSQLRFVQFRIAVATNQSVIPILDAWEYELNALEESHPFREALQVTLAIAVLGHPQADIPLERAFRLARPAAEMDLPAADESELAENLEEAVEKAQETGDRSEVYALQAQGLLSGIGADFSPSEVAEMLSYHAESAEEASKFVELTLEDTTSLGSVLTQELEKNIPLANGLTSRPWLEMAERDNPDWEVVLGTFDHLHKLSSENHLDALFIATERNRAIVHYEYLDNKDAATEALYRGDEIAGSHPLLDSYRAKMRNMEGDYKGALGIFEDTLPEWRTSNVMTPKTHIFHDAIEAAGELGKWNRATHWAERGQESAKRLTQVSGPYVELCYIIDKAFSVYKDGDPCESFQLLANSISQLPTPSNPKMRMLYRRAAHVVVWIHQDLGGMQLSRIQEPPPGLASQFESDPEGTEADVMEKEALFSIISESAELADCSEVETNVMTSAEAKNVITRSMRVMRDLNQGIRSAAEDLPDRFMSVVNVARERVPTERPSPSSKEPEVQEIVHMLTYGVINELASENPNPSVLDEWRNRLEEIASDISHVTSWFKAAGDSFSAVRGDRRTRVKLTENLYDKGTRPEVRLIAAGALARSSDDEFVRLLSLAVLTTTSATTPYGVAANEAIAELAGVEATSGNGIQETARAVVESDSFDQLRSSLSPNFSKTLRDIAEGDIDWGRPEDQPAP